MATWASGATTVTAAPQVSRPAIFRAATRPPPTTRHRRPLTTRPTGYKGAPMLMVSSGRCGGRGWSRGLRPRSGRSVASSPRWQKG